MAIEKTVSREKHSDLKTHVDERRIRAAIEAAETGTSGSIHVSIAEHIRGKTHGTAARAFKSLGYATPGSAAVLFFVVPSRRELSVLGGEAIHARVGDAYWHKLVAAVVKRVRDEDLTSALVHGIEEVGRELSRHFPSTSDR